ncbi:MAG: hypothetical protein CM15mL5_1230 [uncultured marine virus]|nr:MAG: hypothetical protein CM15mL5_1230 [uncultured marine virus]
MTESRDAKLIAIYDNFIEDEEDERTVDVSLPSQEVEITNTMGYVSSVEDARKKFESLLRLIKNLKKPNISLPTLTKGIVHIFEYLVKYVKIYLTCINQIVCYNDYNRHGKPMLCLEKVRTLCK